MKSLYDILGVDNNSSPKDIKKAYKKKAKRMHPDVGGEKDEFVDLHQAYLVLSDPTRKDEYDKTGQTKQINIEEQARMEIGKFFIEILGKINEFNSINIIKYMDKRIDETNNTAKQMRDTKEKIAVLEKTMKRFEKKKMARLFKSNIFKEIISENIKQLRCRINEEKKRDKVFNYMKKILSEYKDNVKQENYSSIVDFSYIKNTFGVDTSNFTTST